MSDTSTYTSVLDDLWRVVQVLLVTPIDELLTVTRELERTAPAAGYMNGTITPRRLQRDAKMLALLVSLQAELRSIDVLEQES